VSLAFCEKTGAMLMTKPELMPLCAGAWDVCRTDYPVTSPIDLWLCSTPCTPATPCLWDLEADPSERVEVAASNPTVAAALLAQLQLLQRSFRNATSVVDNGRFCEALKNRTFAVGSFLGPWL
jgi:hypothetical protein